jgi:predicted murein hydrolase (TIGR00659 family)
MSTLVSHSSYFGFVLTVAAYLIGCGLKKKFPYAIMNPLLIGAVIVIAVLTVGHIDTESYYKGSQFISYLLTPATVCLAIPLYKQLRLLKEHALAVIVSILSGVLANACCILLLSIIFSLNHQQYVSFLPKSITTAIGMGVCEEAGGIVTLTVTSIIFTGILGNVIGENVFKLLHIHHPIAKGLALGTASHAIGTAKALELGEIEGAVSSLSIAVSGLMTVIAVPLFAGFIK